MRKLTQFAVVLAVLAGFACGDDDAKLGGENNTKNINNANNVNNVNNGENRAPSIGSVTVAPASPKTDEDVTAAANDVTDADGDSVELRYEWSVNGSVVGTEATLSADNYVAGDTVLARITPFDGIVEGASASATVVVQNSRPVINGATITPSQPSAADQLSVNIDADDADGDELTYTYVWKVDGVEASTSATFDPVLPSGAITVTVVASDGMQSSDPFETEAIDVVNFAPPVPGAPTLDGDAVWIPTSMTCTVPAVVDPEGESVTYEVRWLKDGMEVSVVDAPGGVGVLDVTETGGVFSCEGRATDASGFVSEWSAPSTSVDQNCVEGTLTLPARDSVSIASNDMTWTDELLRAYELPGGQNTDIVGWVGFSLNDGPAIRGIVSARLELYAVSVYRSAQIAVIQSSSELISQSPTNINLPRGAEIAGARSLSENAWAMFDLDMAAWTEQPTASEPNFVVGVDNLQTAYSFVYFSSVQNTGMNTPQIVLTVCESP